MGVIQDITNYLPSWQNHIQESGYLKAPGQKDYHQKAGYNFKENFPNTPAYLADALAKGYQYSTEGIGSFFNEGTFSDAMARAKEESRLNSLGFRGQGFDMDEYNQTMDFARTGDTSGLTYSAGEVAPPSGTDVIGMDEMNTYGQVPMGTDVIGMDEMNTYGNTIAEAMIDEDRIPGRVQESVPNYQNWFERMMSGAQNKLGGAWGKTKELGSRFKEGARPVWGLASLIGNATNPLNPDSYNYNPELSGELNYLNTQPNMLVDNATSGLLQYGPDSVLSGKNVMSLLGSNSYNEALNNKAGWFEDRLAKGKTISRANYNKAKAEKKAHQNRIQERLNKENAAAAVNAARQVKMEQAHKGGQNPSAGTFSGHSPGGISQQTSRDARGGMSGWRLARGGRVGYADGGLATLFARRG